MGSKLTEANWQSRRIKLRNNITAAERAYEDTCFRAEMGDASSDDITKASGALAELNGRLAALDAAWTRTKAEMEAERAEQDFAARRQAATEIEGLLADRVSAASAIEKAIVDLTAAWRLYQELGGSIVAKASEYRVPAGIDVIDLRGAIDGPISSPAGIMAGLMLSGGLNLSDRDFGADKRQSMRGIVQHVGMWNETIRAKVGGIMPVKTHRQEEMEAA